MTDVAVVETGTPSGADPAFTAWMEQVDLAVRQLAWCSVYDLPDCAFREMYDDGTDAAEAADVALAEAGFALDAL